MADGLGIHGRRRARWLAAAAIGAPILWSGAAQAECGSYEDETRTTYRELRWEDFRGPRSDSPKRGRGRKAAPDIAYISTSAQVTWSRVAIRREGEEWVAKLVGLCVRSVMHKDRSGTGISARTPDDLAHEQGHFDITEHFADVLRASLGDLEYRAASSSEASRGLKERMKDEHIRTMSRCAEMQAHYDEETLQLRRTHRRKAQKRWFEKIDALLHAQRGLSAEATESE